MDDVPPRAKRRRSENKMATQAYPLHPSPLLPATVAREDPTRDRRPGPTKKTKAQRGRNEDPGLRTTAASRHYIPFEAMSAHAHTGRHAIKLKYRSGPTPRALSTPAAWAGVYVCLPAHVPRRDVPSAENRGGRMA